jgi:hypothetical protein
MSFSHFHVAALAAAALAAACFAPRTYADEWNKKTVVNISGPIEIPGRVLPRELTYSNCSTVNRIATSSRSTTKMSNIW